MPLSFRRLVLHDMDRAAIILRTAFDERLPWLAGLHTPEQDREFFRGHVFAHCETWGAFEEEMIGFIAFREGWIDQLYVLPGRQGMGAGGGLLRIARAAHSRLHLWTFRRNLIARRFYERRGFVALEETDGHENEEREPAILYGWPG